MTLQVKTKMQALCKQYCNIINANKETGNSRHPLKPKYWDNMVNYFADRDGLSGHSLANSNPPSVLLSKVAGGASEDLSESEEETEAQVIKTVPDANQVVREMVKAQKKDNGG